MNEPQVRLRPVTDDDEPLMLDLMADARQAELSALPDGPQRTMLVQLQHRAQMASYRAAHPDAAFDVIELDGQAIGRLFLATGPSGVRVVDVSLLPQWRGQGVGGRLLRGVCADADRDGLPVTLHVVRWNPARHLYERLGFVETATDDVYARMDRPADCAS